MYEQSKYVRERGINRCDNKLLYVCWGKSHGNNNDRNVNIVKYCLIKYELPLNKQKEPRLMATK